MNNYSEIRRACEKNGRISERVVDEFLISYAARYHNLEKKMNQQFARYRHVTSRFETGTVNMLKSQFIAHRIFREEGLIGKLMKLPAMERFRGEERDYLLQQAEVPWRFSFSVILEAPSEDFFRMKDIFSGEEYLLFSPGTSQMNSQGPPLLWFNLIGFNGSCWQSYGPIGAYYSFQPGDIWFFATELNPEIEDEAEVSSDIENNPLPYMMLHSGAAYPLTFHKKDQVVYLMAEHDLEMLNTAELKKSFTTAFDSGVYRFTLNKWGEHPHFAQAYFDENLKLILFIAMTDRGFRELVKAFNAFGHDFPDTPYLRINLPMLTTAQDILKKKVVLNEYEELFHVEPDEEKQEIVDKMNAFMALVLPDINAGRVPDIEAAVEKTGVHMETARDMVDMVMEKRGDVPVPDTGKEEVSLYREIYLLADEIREMEPWKEMYETDLFGVKIPGTDRIYFISVMGAEGEYFALAAYKGYQGVGQFMKFQENADEMPPETILTLPHLMLSFTDREALDREQLEAIKKSGVRFRGRGKWQMLEDIDPGFIPRFPGGEALSDLLVLLEQVAVVVARAKGDTGYLYREGKSQDAILVRTPAGSPGRLKWNDRYETFDPEKGMIRYKMTYSRETCSEISRLSETPVVLQADLILLPAPVKEQGKKGYFPFVLLLVDKETGLIPGMDMLTPQPDLHSMYESVPQRLLEEIGKLGYRPEKIEIRSNLLFGLVQGALKEAWCTPVQVKHMPQMDEAAGSLISHLGEQP